MIHTGILLLTLSVGLLVYLGGLPIEALLFLLAILSGGVGLGLILVAIIK